MSRRVVYYGSQEKWQPETKAYLNNADVSIENDNTIYFSATAYEITGAEIWTALDEFVVSIKNALGLTLGTNNLNTKFKFWYPRIGGTSAAHAVDLVTGTTRGTFSGGWTHDPSGATPNGSNGYMNSGHVNSDFNKDDISFGFVSKTNTSGLFADFGNQSGVSGDVNMYGRNGSGQLSTRLADNGINSVVATSNSLGLFAMSRQSGTQYKSFQDGIVKQTYTTNTLTFIAKPIIEGASNSTSGTGISPIQYSPRKRTHFFGGSGLSDTEMADIYTAIAQIETTLMR